MKITAIFFLSILLLLCSCQNQSIVIEIEPVGLQSLASVHVGTPDPRLLSFPYGQRIHITTNLPHFKEFKEPYLRVTIRYLDCSEESYRFFIDRKRTHFIIPLLDSRFCEKRGMLCYLIELFDGETKVEEWRHQLYIPWIDLSAESSSSRIEQTSTSSNMVYWISQCFTSPVISTRTKESTIVSYRQYANYKQAGRIGYFFF